jgi:hypothetical protein
VRKRSFPGERATNAMSKVLTFRRRHAVEVERLSVCGTWTERFFVEVRAAAAHEALEQVAFTLRSAERIVSPMATTAVRVGATDSA